MLFNSLEFIYGFLPLTLIAFYLATHYRLPKLAKTFLLLASLFFYAYWKLTYFLLMMVSIIVNYVFAVTLEKYRSKNVLKLSLCWNLGLLGYFKYFNFFIENLNPLFSTALTTVRLAIPLGISFYTFQQITYLVDVYQGKIKRFQLGDYALCVTFFPHLIAGPILHYGQIMPQFSRLRTYRANYRHLFLGIFFFVIGLFQKLVIADFLSPIADRAFMNAHLLNVLEAWGGLFAYSFQLYFDFAGYSNMAIGLGWLFNIQIIQNFNSPYQAVSFIDFWKRWHMSLSQFLKDYVYIPLGGNRLGVSRKYFNILLTMLIGGFWHGAGWTFLLWGFYHGVLLVLNHWADDLKIKFSLIGGRVITFIMICYGWVWFRASHFSEAVEMSKALLGFHGFGKETYFLWKHEVAVLAILGAAALFMPNAQKWSQRLSPTRTWCFLLVIVFLMDLLYLNRESSFLYFQF
ncbi:MAG: MBOAT family protein [Candidatus Omnitrophica bacterium]|nr:MBOAT family protein [Candidatus Omnitrophota bacterium]